MNNNHAFNNGLIKTGVKIKVTILKDNTIMIFRSKTKTREYLKLSESKLNRGIAKREMFGMKFEILNNK